jgi:hypothetical protein
LPSDDKIQLAEAYSDDKISIQVNEVLEAQKKYVLTAIRELDKKVKEQIKNHEFQERHLRATTELFAIFTKPSTEQLSYLTKLIRMRKKSEEIKKTLLAILTDVSKEEASVLISRFKSEIFGDRD